MKTRSEHLSVLPTEILEEIHEEIKKNQIHWLGKNIDVDAKLVESLSYDVETFKEAMLGAFILAESQKGQKYWLDIIEKYTN